MNAHDILKQKLLDTEDGHATGITRAEVIQIMEEFSKLKSDFDAMEAEFDACIA